MGKGCTISGIWNREGLWLGQSTQLEAMHSRDSAACQQHRLESRQEDKMWLADVMAAAGRLWSLQLFIELEPQELTGALEASTSRPPGELDL